MASSCRGSFLRGDVRRFAEARAQRVKRPLGAEEGLERLVRLAAAAASEKPAIYEVKDGKPNLINFDLVNGTYIVPKIVDNGYLAIGKKKLAFVRQQ